jgi:glycosyltransferase involved in cell wall biosynthesis
MAAGNCIVANNHAPNLEVLGDAGLSYDARAGGAGLARVLQQALDDPGRAAQLGERARRRAQALYSWESVTDAYERLCTELWRPPGAATRASRRGLHN